MDAAFLENFAANGVLDGFRRFDETGEAGIHAGHELFLPAQQRLLARTDEHDHDRIGAREMLGLATRTVALPAAFLHGSAVAAIGAKTMALMPGHQRFRHR